MVLGLAVPVAGSDEPWSIVRESRNILVNCEEALKDVEGQDGARWHRQWLLCLVLLRMIVDELEGLAEAVNAPETAENAEAIRQVKYERAAQKEWWADLKGKNEEPQHMYWSFIWLDRNLAVHRMRLHATPVVRETSNGTEYFKIMRAGPFKDRDPLEVYREAVRWWEVQLAWIETRAKALREAA